MVTRPRLVQLPVWNWLASLLVALGCAPLVGCAPLRLPAVDPTGSRIFLPHPNTTELVWPRGGGLPQPAFKQPDDPEDCPEPLVPAAPGDGEAVVDAEAEDYSAAGGWRSGLLRRSFFPAEPEAGVTLTPTNLVVPVGSDVVLVGGACGGDGYYRKREPIEWLLGEGSVGTFVDLAQPNYPLLHCLFRGPVPGKVCHNYAVGETVTRAQVLDRGTVETTDDVSLEAGETWISLTASTEGTSHVTFFAPELPNFQQRQQTALIHWIDAQWTFPPPAFSGGGAQELTTVVTRRTDNGPATGYLVRYEILGGAPATLGSQGLQAVEVPTDGLGRATVRVSPTAGLDGATQIAIQVIRPGRTSAEPSRLVLGQGSTLVSWSAAQLGLTVGASQGGAVLGQQIGFRIVVTNQGSGIAEDVVVRSALPAGTEWVNSVPLGQLFHPQLEWRLGRLQPGQSQPIDVTLAAREEGTVQFCASVQSAGATSAAQQCASVQVASQGLEVTISGAENADIGQRLVFDITVSNLSQQTLSDVEMRVFFDAGLQSSVGGSPLERTIPQLGPGQSQTFPVGFDVIQPGQLCQRVEVRHATAGVAEARKCIDARSSAQPQARITVTPDRTILRAGQQVGLTIVVENAGAAPLSRLQIVDQFDRDFEFVSATQGSRQDANQVQWLADNLPAGARISYQVVFRGAVVGQRACHRVHVTSDEGAQAVDQVCLQILAADAADPGGIGLGSDGPAPQEEAAVTPPDAGPGNIPQLPRSEGGSANNVTGPLAGLDAVLNIRPETASARQQVELTITIQNLASSEFRRITPRVMLPEGVQLVSTRSPANAPARFGRSEQELIFETTEVIRPGERALTYIIFIRPTTAGSYDFELEVQSPDLAQPLRSTRTLEVFGAAP